MGHVIRCITFGLTLRKKGVEPIFLTSDYDKNTINLIEKYNFVVERIVANTSLLNDAKITGKIAKKHKVKFILIDLSHIFNLEKNQEYLLYFTYLKNNDFYLVSIDDLNKVDFEFDIHIIPYVGAEKINYKLYSNTKYLLGPSYFIFSPSLITLSRKEKKVREDGKNVLLTMGGSDVHCLSLKIGKILSECIHINLRIIIGLFFQKGLDTQINTVLRKTGINYKLLYNADVPEQLFWADIVISGGGLIKYEAALTGVPNLIVSQFDIETKRADEYEKIGCAKHIGQFNKLSNTIISNSIIELLDNHEIRKKMSSKGIELLDGKGMERIINNLPKEFFT